MKAAKAWTRGHIAGATLGRVANLGVSYQQIQTDMFRVGHPQPVESACDRIRAYRIQPDPGPMLKVLVSECFDEDQRSPVRLLAALSYTHEMTSPVPPSFPSHVLASGPARTEREGDFDVADCHLHSGAAIDLSNLLDILASSTHHFADVAKKDLGFGDAEAETEAQSQLRRMWAGDYVGESFLLPVVLGGVRAHLARLTNPVTWMNGKDECGRLFAEGRFWAEIGIFARTFDGPDLLFRELTSGFDVDAHSPSDLPGILRNEIDQASHSTAAELRELTGLLSGIALLHGSITSIPGEGLSRFVDRFDRMGLLRDLITDDAKSRLVELSCASVFTSLRVKAAEFRKTVVVREKNAGALEASIRKNLSAHLEGASRFAGSSGRRIRIAMPLGYHRSKDRPQPDPDRWVARYRLGAVSRLTEALIRTLDEHPAGGDFITGVDVAGDEASMPSWPFLVAYQRLQNAGHAGLRRALHVGESFDWPLQGVRRIADALDPASGVHSIGHALALDAQVSDSVVGEWTPALPNLEVIHDLCWLISAGIEVDRSCSLLEALILDCGLGSYGVEQASDVVEGWEGLRSLPFLHDIGVCDPDQPFQFIEYANDSTIRRQDPVARAAWAFAFCSPGADVLGGFLDGQLRASFLSLQSDALELARDYVAKGIRSRGITIEACPTSNRRLANLPSWRSAHFERFVRTESLRVSVSSDDPVVFSTNVESEVRTIATWFDPDLARQMAAWSLEACSARARDLDADELLLASEAFG